MRVLIFALLVFAYGLPVRGEPVLEFLGASTVDLGNPHDLKLSPDGKYLLVSASPFSIP